MENIISPLNDNFSRAIGFSIAAHIALVLLFTVKAAVFPSQDLQIRSAIKVDIVALPEKTTPAKVSPVKKLPPKVQLKAKVKPKPKPKAKPIKKKDSLKKTKAKQTKAIDRLKAMQAIEKLKKESEGKEKQKPAEKKLVKGNVVNAGSSLTGLDKLKFDEYFQSLQQHIKSHWDLPQWLANANLKAQAVVLLDERGYVVRREIVQSSMNEIFDAKVLQTIDGASPCPAPPARLVNVLQSQGIIFNFP